MSNITIEEIEDVSNIYAENHAFRVPYDGSNNFYDCKDFKCSKEGFIEGYKYAIQNKVSDISAEDENKIRGEIFKIIHRINKVDIVVDEIYKLLSSIANERKDSEIGFLIQKGDEVNSILIAALRVLSPDQKIVLRDKLIRRTPAIERKDSSGSWISVDNKETDMLLTNESGDTFIIPDTLRNEELRDFFHISQPKESK